MIVIFYRVEVETENTRPSQIQVNDDIFWVEKILCVYVTVLRRKNIYTLIMWVTLNISISVRDCYISTNCQIKKFLKRYVFACRSKTVMLKLDTSRCWNETLPNRIDCSKLSLKKKDIFSFVEIITWSWN